MTSPKVHAFPLAAFGHAGPPPVRQPARDMPIPSELSSLILRKAADPRTTEREFLGLAELAARAGAAGTAAALRARAAQKAQPVPAALPPVQAPVAGELGRAADEMFAAPPPRRPTPASVPVTPAAGTMPEAPRAAPAAEARPAPPTVPIPGLPLERWNAFEALMARGAPTDVTPAGRLGMFAMSPRRLQDLGLVREAKKLIPAEARSLFHAAKEEADPEKAAAMRDQARTLASKGAAWHATWADGMSEEKFLGSPDLQRRAFRKSMREYAKACIAMYRQAFGKSVNDKKVTLSGLLAVAHIAGAPGLDSWLKDRSIREKFPQTTKAFATATGIF